MEHEGNRSWYNKGRHILTAIDEIIRTAYLYTHEMFYLIWFTTHWPDGPTVITIEHLLGAEPYSKCFYVY